MNVGTVARRMAVSKEDRPADKDRDGAPATDFASAVHDARLAWRALLSLTGVCVCVATYFVGALQK